MKIIKSKKIKSASFLVGMMALVSSMFVGCGKKEVSADDLYIVDYNVHDLLGEQKEDEKSDYMLATLEVDDKHICKKDDCNVDIIADVADIEGKYKSAYLKLRDVENKDKFICYSYHYFKDSDYIVTYVFNSDGEERVMVTFGITDLPYPNGASLSCYLDFANMSDLAMDMDSIKELLGNVKSTDDIKTLKVDVPNIK